MEAGNAALMSLNVLTLTFVTIDPQACDAWKKEAHEASEKAKLAEREKQVAMQLKEEVSLGSSTLPNLRLILGLRTSPNPAL